MGDRTTVSKRLKLAKMTNAIPQTTPAKEQPVNRTPYTTRTARYAAMAVFAVFVSLISMCASARDTRPADGRCEWTAPGSDKYMLPLAAAVDKLAYIPVDVRTALKARLQDPRKHHNADDHVAMTRAGVVGEMGDWQIRDMNRGNGAVCWGEVTREGWSPEHTERALVFCAQGWCVAYFSVCRNIASAVLVQPRRPPSGMRAPMPFGVEETWTDVAQLDLVPVRISKPSPPTDPRSSSSSDEDTLEDWWWPPVVFRASPLMPPDPYSRTLSGAALTVPAVVAPIPEPDTVFMLLLGLVCVAAVRKMARGERGVA